MIAYHSNDPRCGELDRVRQGYHYFGYQFTNTTISPYHQASEIGGSFTVDYMMYVCLRAYCT